ncbi:MAG: geranylgeranylglyceryl/heptaprenylglyceryl phosphate synthase [Candidatus Aenigmarchaeota archaeon]|nr:geranylgeranylglyceryl/heptaprenylglyceryl phosphate synthase [Candidatus Aenigmarchaeota archaeon]
MVFEEIMEKLKSQKLHFTLIDPDKQSVEEVIELAKTAKEAGTDAFMVGGSSSTVVIQLDEVVKKIKESTGLPIILFPHSHAGISRYADAIFFMSLLNSRNTTFLVEEQLKGAPLIKAFNLETIPMGYLMFESGVVCASHFVSDAKLLPHDKPDIAVAYALTAKYFGMKVVYLEGGSGAKYPVSNEVISSIKKNVKIPIIVGGGIRDKETAREKLDAGADIIVTGTINEGNQNRMVEIIKEIKK